MADSGQRVEAAAEFTVRLDGKSRRATPGVVFDCPEGELAALLACGNVVRTTKPPTPYDEWPAPPDPFRVTEVGPRGTALGPRDSSDAREPHRGGTEARQEANQ